MVSIYSAAPSESIRYDFFIKACFFTLIKILIIILSHEMLSKQYCLFSIYSEKFFGEIIYIK